MEGESIVVTSRNIWEGKRSLVEDESPPCFPLLSQEAARFQNYTKSWPVILEAISVFTW